MKTTMMLNRIIIPRKFSTHMPKQSKILQCEKNYKEYGELDRKIVVSKKGVLLDGYVAFLMLRKLGEKSCTVYVDGDSMINKDSVKSKKPSQYVFGHHMGKTKTYVWKVNKATRNINHLKVGNIAIVDTKRGRKPIIIDDIQVTHNAPVDMPIRKVVRCVCAD